jgi:hypothetical protein
MFLTEIVAFSGMNFKSWVFSTSHVSFKNHCQIPEWAFVRVRVRVRVHVCVCVCVCTYAHMHPNLYVVSTFITLM